jgi:hypothetical protein
MVLEKRKKFHAYSGTNRSLFRLRLRLLHVMLDVILIVYLVVFALAWLVSNDWDCLMSLWKKSCVVFIIWEHVIMVFSFEALFGLTWCMLTPCLTLQSRHIASMIIWFFTCDTTSFGFWLVIPLYALVNDVLSLCMIMAVIALLTFIELALGLKARFCKNRITLEILQPSTSKSLKVVELNHQHQINTISRQR